MKIKTSELEGASLDWAVAKALGARFKIETFQYRGQYGTSESDAGDYARANGIGGSGSHSGPWVAISLDRHPKHPAWRSTSDAIWRPSTDWSQGGPLVEKHISQLLKWSDGEYEASVRVGACSALDEQGPTPLIAAMRAIVAAELGDEVEVPDELMEAA